MRGVLYFGGRTVMTKEIRQKLSRFNQFDIFICQFGLVPILGVSPSMNALSAMPSQIGPDGLVAFADDSPSAKAALETVLRRAGYDVAGFDCADDLIDQLDGLYPRAIILDIEMPGMSGFEAFCEIRRRYPNTVNVPVFFFSAHYDADTRAQADALGAADFISKDASPTVVLEQLNRVLGKSMCTC